MAVGAARDMGVERHHVEKEARAGLAAHRPWQEVELVDDPVRLPEDAGEFVRVAVPTDLQEQFQQVPADSSDLHI